MFIGKARDSAAILLAEVALMASRKSFLLRLPPELMDQLNRWAKDELRSLNAQIEYALRDALRKQRRTKDEPRVADEADREE